MGGVWRLLALTLVGCGGLTRHSPTDTGGAAGTEPTSPSTPPSITVGPSSGCGLELPAEQLPTVVGTRQGYTPFFVHQTGATLTANVPGNAGERQFFVRVPSDYDRNRPYRVVYVLQGCGGQHSGDKNSYPLFDADRGGTEQAVYVALSIPDNDANPGCFDTTSGAESQEWEAFDLVHAFVESHYCLDNDRIYVAGFGSGGKLSNMYGCYFGGTPSPPLDDADLAAGWSQRRFAPRWPIRGRALVSGGLSANQPLACNGPSAGLWMHDAQDHSSPIESAIDALNLALKTNGCNGSYADGPRQAWLPPGVDGLPPGTCQRYTGCPSDVAARYPLVFCTTNNQTHSDMLWSFVPTFSAFVSGIESGAD